MQWGYVEGRAMIEAWRRSGLTLYQFARQHGTTEQRLGHWRKRVDAASNSDRDDANRPIVLAPASLQRPLKKRDAGAAGSDACRPVKAMVQVDGVTIALEDATPEYLAQLLHALARAR
jgi:hypothetical protein